MSPAADARPAGASLTLRLLATLLLIVLVATATMAGVAHIVIENARQQQLKETQEHFSTRLRTLDEAWRNGAYATRQQLELWQASSLDPDIAVRQARLRTLLVSLADQSDFSHAAVVGRDGKLLFTHGTRSQGALPLPGQASGGLGWVYGQADRTVYRTVAGDMRYDNQTAQLVLFFPIDNALLGRLVFPGASLSLRHEGVSVARSDGEGRSPASAPAGASALRSSMPWSAQPGAPLLDIERAFVSPLSEWQVLMITAAGAASFVALGWLVLGRWVRSQSRRLNELQQTATAFAAVPNLSPELEVRLALARGPQDDISTLAEKLRAMMQRIEQAHDEQARAAAALAELNLGLEARVAERTRELESARDEALAGARAKEQFLSNMSHEIRTPMNGMLGALDLMSRTELTARQAEYIDVASASGEALLAIINEVLDFAKIGSGQLRRVSEPIDVNAVARSVTLLFAAAAQRKDITLRLDADAALTGWRLGDSMHLRQVLINLAGNAIKFTQRGEIVVRTRLVPGALGERIAFEVADTGPGIDASQHSRIFDPFVQVEGPAQQLHGGTGLGLAISRLLVRAMGGELALRSAPGEGASFSFELALAIAPGEAVAAAPEAPRTARPGRLPGRVLLVEDNDVNRLIAAAMLEELGLDVVQAENGAQALESLARLPVSLVLMDCQMPVMDGYETTHRIREAERLGSRAHLPVIALTANALSGDVERCLGAGMDDHLAKPFSLEQLHGRLQPWLDPTHTRQTSPA